MDACSIAGASTYLPLADDRSVSLPIPFSFRYWDTDLAAGSLINISSNGWIGMDSIANAAPIGLLPSASRPNAVIAALWGDGVNRTPGQCVVTVGSAPNRQWIIEWSEQTYSAALAGASLTYEIILSETTHTIDLAYGTMTFGRTATVGIEDFTGSSGFNGCPRGVGACMPATGQVMRFVPTL